MDRGVECFLNETAPLIVGVVMNGAERDTLGGTGVPPGKCGCGRGLGDCGSGRETMRKRGCKRPREK